MYYLYGKYVLYLYRTIKQIEIMFTYSIFPNINEVEDFIWSYLYDNGIQYKPYEIQSDGRIRIYHEEIA